MRRYGRRRRAVARDDERKCPSTGAGLQSRRRIDPETQTGRRSLGEAEPPPRFSI